MASRGLHKDPVLETGNGAVVVSGRRMRAIRDGGVGLSQAGCGFVFVLKLGENSVLMSKLVLNIDCAGYHSISVLAALPKCPQASTEVQ